MPITLDTLKVLQGEVRKVLVTGGSGFIGQHVAEELFERGMDPVIYDRQRRADPVFETILGDIRDGDSVTEAVAHTDAVIHLAGVLGTQETIDNPRPAAATNVLGGLNVFQAIRQYKVPAVYICVGNHWMENSYSITKTTAERFARMFNQEHGTHIAIMRVLNAYGPGQGLPYPWGPSKVRKIMPTFIAQALSGQPISVYGDGEQVMDMVYVEDVARGLVDGLTADHTVTHEIGTGRATTVNEIAETILSIVGGGEIEHVPMRRGEPPKSTVLAASPHPAATTTLEDGTKHAVDYFGEILG